MLDTEPTGGGSDTAASASADTAPTPTKSVAAPRRRRRATPDAAEPEAATTAADSAPADSAASEAAAAAAPAPRRRRAATRPASAPAQNELGAAEATTEATPEATTASPPAAPPDAPVTGGTDSEPSAGAPKRTRARRPAAAAAAETAADGPRADGPTAGASADASSADAATSAPAPEQAAPSRSRRRSAAVPVPEAAVLEVLVEQPVVLDEPAPLEAPGESPATAGRGRRRRSTAVTFAPPVDDSVDPAVEPAPAAKAALPPIGSLFQAPDPANATPARRRRAARSEAPAVLPLLDADGEPIADELAEELLADATDIVALDAEGALAAEEIDEDEDEATESGDEDGSSSSAAGRRRRRGRRGRGRGRPEDADGSEPAAHDDETAPVEAAAADEPAEDDDTESDGRGGTRRRRRRRSRGGQADAPEGATDDPPNTVVRVRTPRQQTSGGGDDEVRGLTGSTRLEAKRQRRREGREQGKRRPPVLTEAEFLARREAVDRVMVVRQSGDRTQIAVLEDNVLVEHYVTKASATSYAGNVYLGKVQNVLPSMEAAFVDIGKGRNAVLYAGEVNYDASGIEGRAHRIEQALKPGQTIMVQVTKDPIGHKGSRLTSQISLPGRFLVYVPDGRVTGISRKLPDAERTRLKAILKRVMPEDAGVIVRTAAEGASEEDLERDVARLHAQWESIQDAAAKAGNAAPALLYAEPDLVVRVIRDIFNEDFRELIVQGGDEWETVENYVAHLAPDLAPRLTHWVDNQDVFSAYRVDEQLTKALDRKVWLPSGGSLVIDRTEAMVVVDVNTGKFVGKGGNLEETVTKNNLEAAEEVVRQLRLRDLGGIIVIDFIDMVLESNRELVLRRLMECLGRDRTKHQVAEVTSLGLVQMTRKRVGQGLLESFSETCPTCQGRGFIVHMEHGAPTVPDIAEDSGRRDSAAGAGGGAGGGSARDGKNAGRTGKGGRERGARTGSASVAVATVPDEAPRAAAAAAIAKIAAASGHVIGAPDSSPGTSADNGSPAGHVDSSEFVEVPQSDPAESAAPIRSGRRGRRGASAPAGAPSSSPTAVTVIEVDPVDVVPVEAAAVEAAAVEAFDAQTDAATALPSPADPDPSGQAEDTAAPAGRSSRRRRGGAGKSNGQAADRSSADGAGSGGASGNGSGSDADHGSSSPSGNAPGSGAGNEDAAPRFEPAAAALSQPAAVATSAPAGAAAPRRRRAASRPAGPAAISPGSV